MIRHLLVPLDGSESAEVILPIVAYFAKCLNAAVRLIHVIEKNAKPQVHNQRHLTNESQAEEYLGSVKSRLDLNDVMVTLHVHTDVTENVAQSITSHAETELPSDLIIMCTHGKSDAHRFLFGSIAQKVAGIGKTPVLFIKPAHAIATKNFQCKKILVPIDITEEHEGGFDFALSIAKICTSVMVLTTVIPTAQTVPGKWSLVGRFLPCAFARMLDIAVENAAELIHEKEKVAHEKNVQTETKIMRGNVAKAIVDTAKESSSDVIILGSHATSGFDAFLEDSIGANVCQWADIPVILVPIHTH